MTRRSNGDHTVIWNPQRGNFIAKATYRLPRPITASGPSKEQALANLQQKVAAALHGADAPPTHPTFKEFWDYADGHLSLSGTERHKHHRNRDIRHYCFPTLGRLRLDEITESHGEALIKKLRDLGLSPSTQINAMKLARLVLNLAVRKKLIPSNPFAEVTLPQRDIERRFLTRDEVQRLLQAARGHPYRIVPKMLVGLGLRSGELCGLEWERVRLTGDNPRVEIRQQLQDGQLVPPKYGSVRTLALPSHLVEALQQHRALQEAYVPKRRRKARWDGHSFVVTTSTLAPLDQHRVRSILRDIGERAGISPHPRYGNLGAHQLRYTAGSLLLEGGANLKEVSVFLGHRDIETTGNIYIGLYESSSRRLAEIGDSFISSDPRGR